MKTRKTEKNWPLSFVIREIALRTTTRHHYAPIRMASIGKTNRAKYHEDVGQMKLSDTLSRNINTKPFWKTDWQFLKS